MDDLTLPLQDVVVSRTVVPDGEKVQNLSSLEHYFELVNAAHVQEDVRQGGWKPEYLRPPASGLDSSAPSQQGGGAAAAQARLPNFDEATRDITSSLDQAWMHVNANMRVLNSITQTQQITLRQSAAASAASGLSHLLVDRTAPGGDALQTQLSTRRREDVSASVMTTSKQLVDSAAILARGVRALLLQSKSSHRLTHDVARITSLFNVTLPAVAQVTVTTNASVLAAAATASGPGGAAAAQAAVPSPVASSGTAATRAGGAGAGARTSAPTVPLPPQCVVAVPSVLAEASAATALAATPALFSVFTAPPPPAYAVPPHTGIGVQALPMSMRAPGAPPPLGALADGFAVPGAAHPTAAIAAAAAAAAAANATVAAVTPTASTPTAATGPVTPAGGGFTHAVASPPASSSSAPAPPRAAPSLTDTGLLRDSSGGLHVPASLPPLAPPPLTATAPAPPPLQWNHWRWTRPLRALQLEQRAALLRLLGIRLLTEARSAQRCVSLSDLGLDARDDAPAGQFACEIFPGGVVGVRFAGGEPPLSIALRVPSVMMHSLALAPAAGGFAAATAADPDSDATWGVKKLGGLGHVFDVPTLQQQQQQQQQKKKSSFIEETETYSEVFVLSQSQSVFLLLVDVLLGQMAAEAALLRHGTLAGGLLAHAPVHQEATAHAAAAAGVPLSTTHAARAAAALSSSAAAAEAAATAAAAAAAAAAAPAGSPGSTGTSAGGVSASASASGSGVGGGGGGDSSSAQAGTGAPGNGGDLSHAAALRSLAGACGELGASRSALAARAARFAPAVAAGGVTAGAGAALVSTDVSAPSAVAAVAARRAVQRPRSLLKLLIAVLRFDRVRRALGAKCAALRGNAEVRRAEVTVSARVLSESPYGMRVRVRDGRGALLMEIGVSGAMIAVTSFSGRQGAYEGKLVTPVMCGLVRAMQMLEMRVVAAVEESRQ